MIFLQTLRRQIVLASVRETGFGFEKSIGLCGEDDQLFEMERAGFILNKVD